ncbi:hypothetical protein M2352_003365 [Azospirillum fermentarium]|uniref:ubiquitin-conjugating enzyme E2 n=1 Tax=Azospirillum fermentarium TaxID=1233114 RepID=UPI0022274C50|nr:ubiquitin-conjugating enzyme E2 [Azospirillum fermentarium]MCW2247731.1 hypothetical protein [Azospirillum fermentarium]
MTDNLLIYFEGPSGERFDADVPCDMRLGDLAADFFADRRWPVSDGNGRRQRAVVELVNPDSPGQTKRLNSQSTVEEAGLRSGATLRIFPEAIAGGVEPYEHQRALVLDHKEMEHISKINGRISFSTNKDFAPDFYQIEFRYTSFTEKYPDEIEPRTAKVHKVEITLGADYPQTAPRVRWVTPIFHPNIAQPDGQVCLGVLNERYVPSLGLAKLVTMLAEMIQWRNFDATNPFNTEAAGWVIQETSWPPIAAIGGHLHILLEQLLPITPIDGQLPIVVQRLLEWLGKHPIHERSNVVFRPVARTSGPFV